MKKIVKPQGEIRFEASTMIDSIFIRGRRYEEEFYIERPGWLAKLQDNVIVCESMKKREVIDEVIKKSEYYSKVATLSNRVNRIMLLFYIVDCIFIFLTPIIEHITQQRNENVIIVLMSAFLFLIGCLFSSTTIENIIQAVLGLIGNKDASNIKKFHSAEHAVINAYYDLNRVPTLKEIKNYSNFAYNCGTIVDSHIFLIFIPLSIFRLFVGHHFLILSLVWVIIIRILYKKEKLYFMEFLMLAKPTDVEYTLAIVAMTKEINDLEQEKKIEKLLAKSLKDIINGMQINISIDYLW